MLRNILFSLCLVCICFSTDAKILPGKSENVAVVPNFWYHPMVKSDSELLVFDEAQNVQAKGLIINFQRINQWDQADNMINVEFHEGTLSSHMLYFHKLDTVNRVQITAEIEFDAPIIGFLADGYFFAETNSIFAPAATHKECPGKMNIWSLEEEAHWTPLDRVTILSPTRIRVEFTNQSATDPLRVITLGNQTARNTVLNN